MDALAQQTENHQQEQTGIKDEIKAVHRHHNEGAGEFQVGVSPKRSLCVSVTNRSGWQSAAHQHQFAEEKQQKLEEKAVEDQTEDEVESRVDEANGAAGSTNKDQMVKRCHMRIRILKQTSSRRTWPRINRRSEQAT